MKNKIEWEKIQEDCNWDEYTFTHRLKVPNGWIVRFSFKKDFEYNGWGDKRCIKTDCMVFVPDNEFEWLRIKIRGTRDGLGDNVDENT